MTYIYVRWFYHNEDDPPVILYLYCFLHKDIYENEDKYYRGKEQVSNHRMELFCDIDDERDATTGSVFMRLADNLRRWSELDPQLDYVFWICEHRGQGQDGEAGRPHAHGALRSIASRRMLERSHRGGFARLIPFRAPQVGGLYAYISAQAITGGEPITPQTMAGLL
jgi:hypothetical protein